IVRAETSVTGVPSAAWSWTVITPDVVPAVMVCADVPMPSLVGAEVTVNVAEGEFVPSLAVTVWSPAATLGTVKEQLKLPLALDWQEPGVVVTVLPADWMGMEWLGVKLVPVTVTVVPTGAGRAVKAVAGVVAVAEAGEG